MSDIIETVEEFEAQVQSIAYDIVSDAWKFGLDDTHDAIHERCDGLAEVIYHHRSRAVVSALQGTDYLDEAEDTWKDCGVEFEDLDRLNTQLAYFAFERAVGALLDSDDRPAICVVNGANGRFVPKVFAERYGEAIEREFSGEDLAILLAGPEYPDYDEYIETWIEILDNLEIEDPTGNVWEFLQGENGDIFARMSEFR